MTLPQRPIAFAGGIAFLLFAVWTWREGRRGGDDDVRVAEPRYVLFAIISSFVLAELGDKTMLATVALASDHNWAGVWIGATVGMVLADGVASVLFLLLGRGRCAGGRCRQRHPQASRASGHVDSARNRRLRRRGQLLATVGRTTDHSPKTPTLTSVTWRRAH